MEFVNTVRNKNFYCHCPDNNGEMIEILKCSDRFTINPSLSDFGQCKAYSRVVSYIGPVKQWHIGKKTGISREKRV